MAAFHPRRVSWEAARVFVAAAGTDVYWWLCEEIGSHLGVMYELRLAETRLRLAGAEDDMAALDAAALEAVGWRGMLDGLLDEHPGCAPLLTQFIEETADRLRTART